MAQTSSYDVIIVGARLAGAATAAFLAREGARVLLLDRAVFPSPTLSCPILYGNSLALFAELGVLPTLEALAGPRINQAFIDFRSFRIGGHFLPSAGGYEYAYAFRREVLDTAFLNYVAELPSVTLRQGFHVTDLLWEDGQVVGLRGTWQSQTGHQMKETLRAPFVVGADGRHSLVARLVEAPMYRILAPSSCVYFAYYEGFEPEPEPTASMYMRREGFAVLSFPADGGLQTVSVESSAAHFSLLRADPEAQLEQRWRMIPELATRGRHARRAGPVRGLSPTASFYRKPFGPGWALVGDAGHYKDPLTAQGIHDALRSAQLVVGAWKRIQQGTSPRHALKAFQHQRDRETAPMYRLTHAMSQLGRPTHPITWYMLQVIAAQPDFARACVSMFNGAVSPARFLSPPSIAWMFTRWELRQLVGWLLGRRPRMGLEALDWEEPFAASAK